VESKPAFVAFDDASAAWSHYWQTVRRMLHQLPQSTDSSGHKPCSRQSLCVIPQIRLCDPSVRIRACSRRNQHARLAAMRSNPLVQPKRRLTIRFFPDV
jgi:hypothetical protein